jgi:2-polyprenyl-6-hydroxyphenyl methylase/3-demethylubiquinone-9 3-methyltransferase
MSDSLPGSLTRQGYWDDVWARKRTLAPDIRWVQSTYFGLALDRELATHLRHGPGARFLEVGCGGGKWLTYFHRRFDYAVFGCDYSEGGCALARDALAAAGVPGTIIHSDLFDLDEQYDVVFSAGLIEHFEDPARVLGKFASILRPGGHIVTLVPNLSGLSGFYHRWLKPETFDTHRVVTLAQMRQWGAEVGVRTVASGALGSLVPQRFPREKMRRQHPRLYPLLWRAVLGPATWLTGRGAFAAYTRLGVKIESQAFSPYLYAIAEKPATSRS